MKSIENTAEVLAYKVLNRLTDKVWIDWAYKMLLADIETESLLIMAGLQEPLNYFQMRSLTDKVFNELGLDYLDEDKIITSYASYLISECLDHRIDAPTVLYRLNDIYISTEYYYPLQEFFNFYYAWEDLQTSEAQWYLDGVDRTNIDQKINDFFQKWIIENS